MITTTLLKKEIISVCDLMYKKGLICATDGNVSVRYQKSEILITASGTHKGLLKEDDIILTDLEGNIISGRKKPSSEIKMHIEVYHRCQGVRAVIHAHPPFCTALSLTGEKFPTSFTPEVFITFGETVPVARYATPSTREVPESIAPFLPEHKAIILAHHGSLTFGKTVWEAFYMLEKLENAAYVYFLAKQLGEPKPLSRTSLEALKQLRR